MGFRLLTTLSRHTPYAGGRIFVVSLSIPAASSSRASTTRIGRRGSENPANAITPGKGDDCRSSSSRRGRVTSMQSLMRLWQKKMVVKIMMRIRRMESSLLTMLPVIERARSRAGLSVRAPSGLKGVGDVLMGTYRLRGGRLETALIPDTMLSVS